MHLKMRMATVESWLNSKGWLILRNDMGPLHDDGPILQIIEAVSPAGLAWTFKGVDGDLTSWMNRMNVEGSVQP